MTSYAYDLMSNLTGVTGLTKIKYPEATPGAGRDALNRTTNYTYDDLKRLKENFTYDVAGNLLTKSDQAGRVTTLAYYSAAC